MRIAIMQPYFFPYIGYFQLMQAVDRFYLYDDVRYIKRGWVNRNRILCQGQPRWLTLPVEKASQNRNINEHRIARDRRFHTLPASITHAYRRAPLYNEVYPLLKSLLECRHTNLAAFLRETLVAVARRLGIGTPVGLTSEIGLGDGLAGQARILACCARLGADSYVNPAGGTDLYDRATFAGQGVRLQFLQHQLPAYPQFGEAFVPGLSIVDVLMFNEQEAAAAMTRQYALV